MAATIDDYRWLVSDAAKPWLARAREELLSATDRLVQLTSKLRKDLTAERAHLVVEQTELRPRAREKFSLAGDMFFTRKGLEQATDEQLASYKATRYAADESIADLCCGIGGDLLAFARRGKSQGVDSDEVTALLAEANASVHGFAKDRCAVIIAEAMQSPLSAFAWHCDPDRRKEGRRATRGELFEPPLESLATLLSQNNTAAIKLAPATEAPPEWQPAAELEWLSSRGECRQQVTWFGRLARHPGQHAATIVAANGAMRTVVGTPDQPLPTAKAIGRYLYEPDAAVLAAKLTTAVCLEHSLEAVSAGIAYLTSDGLVNDPALDGFEVIDILPFDRKQLRAYCRTHGIGRLEIKKRGVELSAESLRKEIVGSGDNAATIIVTPVQQQVRAIVARRLRT